MPEIKSFRGLRYSSKKVSRLAEVLAPPYDVISPKERDGFYKKHPNNVIRLILGKDQAGDSAASNKYTRARGFLDSWMRSGALEVETRPSVYVYVQDYRQEGKPRRRIGFIAAMKIDEKAVLKHENTLAAPKKDRFSLIKEVKTNLSPIWGLYEDRPGAVWLALKKAALGRPAVDVTLDGVRHRLFVTDDRAIVDTICGGMRGRPIFIADGHHRFEVACQYKKYMESQTRPGRASATKTRHQDTGGQASADQPAGWDYVMTYFSDITHNPFTIWPTHRLVKAPKGMKDRLAALAKYGKLERVGAPLVGARAGTRPAPTFGLKRILTVLAQTRKKSKDDRYRFGVYSKKDGFYLFTLDKKFARQVKNDPVSRLDVAVLHRRLIEPCFGIKKIEKSPGIDFTRDPKAAVHQVNSGDYDLVLFLRPTSLGEILLASKKGLKMPQKSTYFYPKLLSGLVFHHFGPPIRQKDGSVLRRKSAADLRGDAR